MDLNEAPTQQAVGYLPIGLIDVASGDSSQSLQAAGYLNENKATFEELKTELNKRGFCVTIPFKIEFDADDLDIKS